MEITQQQSRKRSKRSHKEQNKPSIDRLSSLPDSVLYRILSVLPTRFSVRTSILARRWRYLWAYVPNLHFVNNEDQEIINRVMLLSKVQSINTFRLFYRIDCSPNQLETWITFSIMRDVKRLDLCFLSRLREIALPRCLFTCKTLIYLRLKYCGLIPMSGTVCLPHLKKLNLIDVQYEADESLPHLLSGCPVLEELSIDSHGRIAYCKVSSPTIKRLRINLTFCRHMVEINTPAIKYLDINDTFSDHIKSGPLNFLVEAEVELHNDEMRQQDFLYSRSILEFINRLCNVGKCLYLGLAYSTKFVDSLLSHWTLRSFSNLIDLELKADCRILSKMLENADNLETLIFREFYDEVAGWTEPPRQVPTCLSSRLRIIKLVDIQGEKHELEIIRYLLRNSLVLKKMVIAYHEFLESEQKINMLQVISLFQRGSTTCEVAFVAPQPI